MPSSLGCGFRPARPTVRLSHRPARQGLNQQGQGLDGAGLVHCRGDACEGSLDLRANGPNREQIIQGGLASGVMLIGCRGLRHGSDEHVLLSADR